MSLDFQANYGQPWQYLGSARLSVAANTTASVSFAAYDVLLVQVNIPAYGGSDVASLQFNGDTATNYWTRFLTVAAGVTTLTNVPNAADSMIQLGAATTNGRSSIINITNPLAKSKVCDITTQIGNGNSTAEGIIHLGGVGEWINTTAQVTSILMKTKGGANMGANSGFVVYGRNF